MSLRRALAAALAWLLLSLQSQVLVHPIEHLGKGPKAQETALTSTHAGESCVECLLLAGGLTAVPAPALPPAADGIPDLAISDSYRTRAAQVAAWFRSRAPPSLL